MKVIFIKDFGKIGRKFDIKDVNSGYATNFLIPKGIAIPATPEATKRIETTRATHDAEKKIQGDLLSKSLDSIADSTFTVKTKANEKGHLFAGIHARDIVEAIRTEKGIDIDPAFVGELKGVKTMGEHIIPIVAGGKTIKITLNIVSQ
ncbi:MAG: 50S ribosomal protein L9 [Patescibacteria group bacterium]|nr:50S ribosomal protein L9 [Patescibacteria group bacterium]